MRKLLIIAALAVPSIALAASTYFVRVDLCKDYPQVVTKTGIVLNLVAQESGLCGTGVNPSLVTP